jgi:acetyl esterase/lipase
MNRSQREAAYDNRAAVPGCAAYLDAQNAASARLRADVPCRLDVPYGAGERARFDLFPAADADAPCVVFIHGGYWQRGGRETVSIVARGPLERGWSIAFPGYPLAPDATLTEIVASLRAAIDWLVADGPRHGIAGPLVLAGHSAGGHLAAALLDHPAIVAALPISGIFELGPIRDTSLNAALCLSDDEVATLSPLRTPVVAKPMAIAYGTNELEALVADSRDLHARRAAAHAPGALIPIAGADHFDVLESLREPDGILTRALLGLVVDARALRSHAARFVDAGL